jgi:large subunit ribosomal protein L2
MAIKAIRPMTPGQRGMTTQDFDAITTKRPVRSLITIKKKTSGRNNQGRITTRHKGGGVRKFYRQVNFNLAKDTTATVEHIEYDPNRSARIARIKDSAGVLHYILAPKGLAQGATVACGDEVAVEVGNRLPLKNIPTGSTIHAIELTVGRGAQAVRGAGLGAQLIAKDGGYGQVRMPSGEIRKVHVECMASIGAIGNEQHQNVKIGKAGRTRKMGIRPTVRGVVMNAVDHPHGGGDGGRHKMARPPVTPWGQKTLGFKTRTRKSTSKMIVRSRHAAKRK